MKGPMTEQYFSRPIPRVEMKYLVFLMLFACFSSQVNAQPLGSIAYESEKTASYEAKYEIGLFNLKNRSLSIQLEASNLDGKIEFEEQQLTLIPSEVSSNPSGSGWISTSGNNYVKPRNVKFSVRSTKSENFSVRIRATVPEQTESSGPTVVQEISHGFSYVKSGDSSSFIDGEEENSENELELRKRNSNGEDSEKSSDKPQKNRSDKILSFSSDEEEEKAEDSGVDPVTAALALGAAGSVYYLWSLI